jgi:glycosyltransferase involved in cell wall biosynthesis
MPMLSVVIITHNEDRNIGRCLDTVKVVADDIVVVDSLSTDRTAEICRQYDVNFISRPWQGYSDTKNFGNTQAKYDWVLSVDADETLTEELAKSILLAKASAELKFYRFNRLTNYCGKWIRHSGWYPDSKVRLFDRKKAKWTGQIHEKLMFDKEIKVGFLNGELLHYSYYNISEHVSRMNTFTDIASVDMFDKKKKCSFFKLIFKTKIKFLSVYFWKLGFLDGYYGFIIAILSAMSEFVKYSKLRSLYSIKEEK